MNNIARIHCSIVAVVAAQQILLEVWFLRVFGFVHQDLRKLISIITIQVFLPLLLRLTEGQLISQLIRAWMMSTKFAKSFFVHTTCSFATS